MQPAGPVQNPQFAQPSKVIHLRNLVFGVNDDEIRELCSQWGQVVAVKSQVGPQKNQAFVEMAFVQQAMAIVQHYQSSGEPAKIRGRPTFINYSGRDKLTNITSSDVPTPVLQATMNDIQPDLYTVINLDLLHLVFGAFGWVHKLITHPSSNGGLVAWVQFADAATAAQVKAMLHGQQIPRHLLSEHPQPPTLHLNFSPHADLPVTTQSYCTRDYADAALPWGDPDLNAVAALLPQGEISNVLTINFESTTYPVTLDGVHTICSTYGQVQKIHIFEREGKTVALVQYPDPQMAATAKAALEGHPMYDGGHNVMRPVFSKHRNLVIRPGERSRDYTLPPEAQQAAAAVALGGYPAGAPPGSGGLVGAAPQQLQGLQQGYGEGAAPAAEGAWGGAAVPDVSVTGDDYVKAHEDVLKTLPSTPATMARAPAVPPQQQPPQQPHAQPPQQQQQQGFGGQHMRPPVGAPPFGAPLAGQQVGSSYGGPPPGGMMGAYGGLRPGPPRPPYCQ